MYAGHKIMTHKQRFGHERHKSQFIFEYHFIKLVTQVKKKPFKKPKIRTSLEVFRFLKKLKKT